jgi:hypothetical protein
VFIGKRGGKLEAAGLWRRFFSRFPKGRRKRPIPHTFPKAQAFCGAGDLVAGVSAFQTKSPAGGKDRQRHIAGFPLEKSK